MTTRPSATSAPDLESLEAGLARAAEGRERVDALNALAWELRTREVSRSLELALEARALSIELGYRLGQARAARTASMTCRMETGLREAFELMEESKQLFDAEGDALGSAGARDGLATLHEVAGDLPTALGTALEALEIARAHGDLVRQGFALSSVGGILAASGDVDAGVERLREALSLFEQAGDLGGIGRICMRLAGVLGHAGRGAEAGVYAERCLAISGETGNLFLRAEGLASLGEAALAAGDPVRAEALLREAVEAFPPEARESFSYRTGLRLAEVLIARGAIEDAEREVRETLRRITSIGVSPTVEADAHQLISGLRERQGDLEGALQHLRAAQRLREEAVRLEARNRVAQVEVRAEIEAAKKDAEIHRLRFVELRAMQSKLVEAEKMALLGQLAAGTAHELNSPLGALRSSLDVVRSAAARLSEIAAGAPQTQGAQRAQRALASAQQSSEQAIERIGAIAERFARFTQLDQPDRRDFDVNEGLEVALELLEPSLPAGVSLERRFGAGLPAVSGSPRELNHVFLTLLQNAVEAIDGAGRVTASSAREGEEVVVRVRDTGRGMDAQELSRLFDVAFAQDGTRTKMRMGMSGAYATLQRHGGRLEYESTPGVGTTAICRLPAAR